MLWLHVATTQQGGEDTVIPVETWYLSEPGHVICSVSRTVNLGRDFHHTAARCAPNAKSHHRKTHYQTAHHPEAARTS